MALELPRPATFTIAAFESDTNVAQGDGTVGLTVPSWMNGWVLSEVIASITGAQVGTGTLATLIQLRKRRASDGVAVDLLTDRVNIDPGERSSTTAATAYTIDPDHAAVATGDVIGFVDVDQIPETTSPQGLAVSITLE